MFQVTIVYYFQSGLMQESLESNISIDETDFRVSNYIKSNTSFECNSGKYGNDVVGIMIMFFEKMEGKKKFFFRNLLSCWEFCIYG